MTLPPGFAPPFSPGNRTCSKPSLSPWTIADASGWRRLYLSATRRHAAEGRSRAWHRPQPADGSPAQGHLRRSRSHPCFRGYQWRREIRQAHRLRRGAQSRQRHRSRFRGRLRRRVAVFHVHPHAGWRHAQARRSAADPARWLGLRRHARDVEHLHLGTDGWLYGCHGVFTQSNVGQPGAEDAARTRINAGVWRYHPIKHQFELFAEGTSNPWGIDFNQYGHCITEGCVIPHLWHMIQGGHFMRQAGSTSTRTSTTTSRRSPITSTTRARRRTPAMAAATARVGTRPRGAHGLSRRKLAGEILRANFHEQHPRRAHQ